MKTKSNMVDKSQMQQNKLTHMNWWLVMDRTKTKQMQWRNGCNWWTWWLKW